MIGLPQYLILDGVVGQRGNPTPIATWTLISMAASPSEVEIGDTQAITLTWIQTSDPDNQALDNGIGALATNLRQYITPPISVETTFELTADKDIYTGAVQATAYFRRKRYWFASSDPDIGNADFVFADLPVGFSQEFLTSRAATKNFNCSGGKYFYYMYPASFGVGSPHYTFNGFPGVLLPANVRTVNFTNESGDIASYIVLRSDALQNSAFIDIAFQ
jgi:hypothetical protein